MPRYEQKLITSDFPIRKSSSSLHGNYNFKFDKLATSKPAYVEVMESDVEPIKRKNFPLKRVFNSDVTRSDIKCIESDLQIKKSAVKRGKKCLELIKKNEKIREALQKHGSTPTLRDTLSFFNPTPAKLQKTLEIDDFAKTSTLCNDSYFGSESSNSTYVFSSLQACGGDMLSKKTYSDENVRYLDFGHNSQLLEEVEKNASLIVSRNYESLFEMFQHTERIVSILMMQQKRIRLQEVITNVQQKVKRTYSLHLFAQILHVYPQSYVVEVEPYRAPVGNLKQVNRAFEYVIEPNLRNDIIDYMKSETSLASKTIESAAFNEFWRKNSQRGARFIDKNCPVSPEKSVVNGKSVLDARRMVARATVFRHLLQLIFKAKHYCFLEKKGINLSAEQQSKLKRCHPEFDSDELSKIPAAELPPFPTGDGSLNVTMKDYMKCVEDSLLTLPDKVQKTIDLIRSPEKRSQLASGSKILLSESDHTNETNFERKEPTLMERIRAKQQLKQLREMMRDPVNEKKKSFLHRLERSSLRNICSYFSLKKVSSMKIDELLDQLAYVNGKRSIVEFEEMVDLLCSVAPDHLSIKVMNEQKYIQIKKNNYIEILSLVRDETKKCQCQ